ncbi:MAG: helix-turn-helix domain-containing protein [Erysipelotrichia bacterium]|nr:helix-turn-helix domain-containing protein [Erysipelotrichia bacterium]
MAKQKPLYFFAKGTKQMQLAIVRGCINAIHNRELTKPIEEEFLIFLIECCEELKVTLAKKGKTQSGSLKNIADVDRLRELSAKNKRTKPNYQASRLRMKKEEILRLKKDGMSFRELENYLKIDHSTIAKEMKKWR